MKHIDSRVEAYVAGELGEAEQNETVAHLAACPACAAKVAEARNLWALLGTVGDPQPEVVSPSAWPQIQARTFGRRTRRWPTVAAGTVAVAAGLGLAILMPTPHRGKTELAVSADVAWGSAFWFDEQSETTFSELWLAAADDGSGS